jgi:hypothetical protein
MAAPSTMPCELTSQRKSRYRHGAALCEVSKRLGGCPKEGDLFKSLQHDFAPLDREILKRAFYYAWTTVKETERSVALDDERLAAVLRSKLIEIAQANGPSDAEALRDMLLDRLPASEL